MVNLLVEVEGFRILVLGMIGSILFVSRLKWCGFCLILFLVIRYFKVCVILFRFECKGSSSICFDSVGWL